MKRLLLAMISVLAVLTVVGCASEEDPFKDVPPAPAPKPAGPANSEVKSGGLPPPAASGLDPNG